MKVPHQYAGNTRPSSQGLSGFSVANVNADTFGAGVGRALIGLGAKIKTEDEQRANELKQRQDKTDRFQALTNLSQFQTDFNAKLVEAKRNADPSGKGFLQATEKLYDDSAQEFLKTKVAPELREEFSYRIGQIRQGVIGDGLEFQYKAGDAFFRKGIDDVYQKSLGALNPATGGNPALLEVQRKGVFEAIDASDLSEIEKAELKFKTSVGLEGVVYKQTYKQQIADGAMNISSTVGQVIDAAAAKHGVSADAMRRIAWLESNGDPSRKNPNSSAGGLFQFVDGTASAYGLKNRYDAAEASDAAARLMADNAAGLRKGLGREPSTGELYLAHQQGLGGAIALLSDPNRLAVDAVGYDVVRLNGGAPGMTAGQFAQKWIRKAEGANPTNVDSNPAFSNLSYEERVNLQRDATKDFNEEQKNIAAATAARIDTQVNDLLNGVYDGTKGVADIDAANQEGWLDFNERKKAMDLYEQRNKDNIAIGSFLTQLQTPGAIFNPADEGFRKNMNLLFNDGGPQALQGMDVGFVNNQLVPLVQRTGDIPTDAVGFLNGMVRSNQADQSLFALESLRVLQEADYRAFNARVSDDLAKDVAFYSARKDLYPADELVRLINGGMDAGERQNRILLREEAQRHLSEKSGGKTTLQTLVADVAGDYGTVFTPGLGAVPAFAKALTTDYQTLFVDMYERTGDYASADTEARKLLERTWGVTDFGGNKVLMKYPPEKVGYKPLAGDYSWIDRQVRTERKVPEGGSYQLLSDTQTQVEFERWKAGGPGALTPSYQIAITDENGVTRLERTRIAFEPTPEDLKAEDDMWKRDQLMQEYSEFQRKYMIAEQINSEAGIEMPEEYQEEKRRFERDLGIGEKEGPPELAGKRFRRITRENFKAGQYNRKK